MYITLDDQGISQNFANRSGNFVIYSSLTQFESKIPFGNFAIKYVAKGYEYYNVNGHDYPLTNGQFLLGNRECEGHVYVDSRQLVKGICIDVEQEIMSNVLASYVAPDTAELDISLDTFFSSKNFIEFQGTDTDSALVRKLAQLSAILDQNPNGDYIFEQEFYYELGQSIIQDYIPIIRQLYNIRSVKSATRKDLMYRLNLGKSFIDQNYTNQITIDDVARESHISLFHFFRLFKDVYGVSPYQYIKNKRMHRAGEILVKDDMLLTDLASEVGFNDLFSFSKAFKQFYGCPPSQYRKV